MRTFIVYGIQNQQNGKMYVGVSSGSLTTRWQRHRYAALKLYEESKFYRAIRKYGADTFDAFVIAKNLDHDEAYGLEALMIRVLNTASDGYNTALGGRRIIKKPWAVNGVVYESKVAAAAAFGVPYQKMIKRLVLGHTPEQAVGLIPMPVWKVGNVVVEGTVYPSRASAARAYGKDPKMIAQRINKLGWTLEEALELRSRNI